jgi:hypothetical protein
MKRLSIVAALVAIGVAVPLSVGSSHREAPLTSIDPTADDTDVYAYTAKDAPDALTIAANWVPFEDPAGGPNFYKFDPKARYYINVDNTGDGKYDVRYRFTFRDFREEAGKDSFLYAFPGVSSITDDKLFQKQFYDVERLSYGYSKSASASKKGKKHSRKGKSRKHKSKRHKRSKRVLRSVRTIARNVPVAPNNVGPKTIPNYTKVANEAITELPGGGKVFAGQRDDPFFVDLGMTFDAINLEDRAGKAVDDLAGYGVHSIVLQVPEEKVTKDGDEVDSVNSRNAVVGVWASTERKRLSVLASSSRRDDDDDDERGRDSGSGDWVQVSRLGNPLVNEVIIPTRLKDKFNSTIPADDAQYAGFVLKPELAGILNALFGVNAPEKNRTDIVGAVLTGLDLPGVLQNRQTGKPVDTIKVNLGTPPTADPNPLGVIGGDQQGFPNGRRLTDDVVDIALQVVAGELAIKSLFPELGKDGACDAPAKCPNPNDLGDNVPANDKPFLNTFPYLAEPNSGLNATIKKNY